MEEFYRLLKGRLDEAKRREEIAKEALDFAEEAGIDVSTQRVDYESAKSDLERIRQAYKKRTEGKGKEG